MIDTVSTIHEPPEEDQEAGDLQASCINPLICDQGETPHRVAPKLKYLRSLDHDRELVHTTDGDRNFGRDLIYSVMIAALEYHGGHWRAVRREPK